MTTLYLLPNLLADLETTDFPQSVERAVASLDFLIAEEEKAARKYLKRFTYPDPKTFRDIPIHLLNEHSTAKDKQALIAMMAKGGIWGLISDCGMPCLADPGADLVLLAQRQKFTIQTFAGPSSILFALVLSGLGGQRFTFHGYLPREEMALIQAIRQLEKSSDKERAAQLFIETPYRNQKLLQTLLQTLQPGSYLCIACDLTAETQYVQTHTVQEWKKDKLPDLGKRPCVFVVKSIIDAL